MPTTSLPEGIVENDPQLRHAARLGQPGQYLAVCDGRGLALVPGNFSPDDANACVQCSEAVGQQPVNLTSTAARSNG